SVNEPARHKLARGGRGGSSRQSERLTGRALAHLPDKPIIIKMEQPGCCDHAGKNSFDFIYFDVVLENPERAVSEDKANVDADQGTAAAKNKPHKAANRAVFFHAVAIVDPDKREVLHIVKNLEERNPSEDVRDAVIAIPPKRNARRKQRQLDRIGPLADPPHLRKIDQKQDRHRNGRKPERLLRAMQEPWGNEGRATGVIRFERVGHSFRGKEHRRREPDRAGAEIEPASERGEGTHLRVVDSAEAVGLHHPVPDAPEENNQDDALQIPPCESGADRE